LLYYAGIYKAAVRNMAWNVGGDRMGKSLLTVLTGRGKGKTTAALGMAIRALGHDWNVCLIQFVKGPWKTGEWDALKLYGDRMVVHVKGMGFINSPEDVERHRETAREAWRLAKETLNSPDYNMVILDELTYLLTYEMVDENDVCDALRNRRKDLHVVITGRDAQDCLLELADLVTEMREVKHPLKSGVHAQRGIEY
jgi:cob(I)alamin adenosyltransferase